MKSRWKRKKERFQKNKIKKIIRGIQRRNKKFEYASRAIEDIYFSNKVFYFLRNKNFKTKLPIKLGMKGIIKVPHCFSISENPDETIKILKKLFTYGSELNIHEIVIDHSECVNLEIAASTIMDIIVIAIKEYHRKHKSEISFSGIIPRHGKVKDIFMASGLAAHLELDMESGIKIDKQNMQLFQLKSGRHGSGISDSTATSLAMYIMRCMETQGYTLSDQGCNALSMMFGEVLNNCEIHGGEETIWFALGHYQMKDVDDCYGEVQLVIFNFGNTIYEQMKGSNSTKETREKMRYLEEVHKKQFSVDWDVEMLYTLSSLQEGISRLRDKNTIGNKKRGTGTIRLIENFQNIGQTTANLQPLMTITSGNTHIKFDGKYILKREKFEDDVFGKNERRVIAFNKDNDIFKYPDKKSVIKNNEFFPGTIISFDFFFDKNYLNKIVYKG